MVEGTCPAGRQERTEDLLGALDDEVADLEVVVDWLCDQVDELRSVLATLLQELVGRDDDWGNGNATRGPCRWHDGLGAAISDEAIRWQPSRRRARRYSRQDLLRMVAEEDLQRPGIRKWPRHLLLLALRQAGVIGNAQIAR
jgi:hypothetical protein